MSRDRDRKKFKFRGTSEQTVKDRSTNTGSFDRWIKSKYPTFKVRDGENTGRILPRTWDDTDQWGDNWGIPVKLHYSVGPDKGTYLCNKIRGKTCYLCEERASLARDGDAGKEASDALRPSDRVIVWWIDRDAEKEGPQVYGMPATKVEVEIQLLSKDDDGSLIQITDPDEGYDVIFTKTGSNLKTDYKGVRLSRKPCPIHDKESKQDEWLDFIEANPLSDVLNFYDNDYLEQVYSGKSAKRKDEDEDEEDTKRSKRRSSDDDEDEDEPKSKSDRDTGRRSSRSKDDDEDAEERPSRSSSRSRKDEDEEEAPKTSSKRSRRDEEEDEEDNQSRGKERSRRDEPEEEEKPKRTRRSRDEPEDEEEDEPEPSSKKDRSAQARESVDRLKKNQRKRDEEEEDTKARPSRGTRRSDDDD